MRRTDGRFWSALVAATIFLSCSAAADQQCDFAQDPEASIIACTQGIKSGKWKGPNLAAYYNNRAAAYRAKGDGDRAMADLNEAIPFDPKLALRSTIEVPSITNAATTTAPSPTTMTRSGSIPNWPWLSAIEVTPSATRATTTAPSPT